jgi:hypothetical protein
MCISHDINISDSGTVYFIVVTVQLIMNFLKPPPPDLKCPICGKRFPPSKGNNKQRALNRHMGHAHKLAGDKKIAFAKSGQNLQPIHKTIPPRNVTQQGSKRKRGGSKKGTTANFHTWKWRHARVQDYEQIPKGHKTSWLMKKGISRLNMSRWRLHFQNHEFDPHCANNVHPNNHAN